MRAARLLVVVGVAGVSLGAVAILGHSQVRRPEGAAERFLQAISARNVHGTARWGDAGPAAQLAGLGSAHTPRFSTIEVGRAVSVAGQARIPARVVAADAGNDAHFLDLTARRVPASAPRWRIVAAQRVERAATPSRGGARPARADRRLWLVAAAAVLVVALGADRLVVLLRTKGAGRRPEHEKMSPPGLMRPEPPRVPIAPEGGAASPGESHPGKERLR